MSSFKVRARSVIHPGNYLVEGVDGSCYIFFADIAELSATGIHTSLADAMVQSYEWSCLRDPEWVTLDDLQARASAYIPGAHDPQDQPQPGF